MCCIRAPLHESPPPALVMKNRETPQGWGWRESRGSFWYLAANFKSFRNMQKQIYSKKYKYTAFMCTDDICNFYTWKHNYTLIRHTWANTFSPPLVWLKCTWENSNISLIWWTKMQRTQQGVEYTVTEREWAGEETIRLLQRADKGAIMRRGRVREHKARLKDICHSWSCCEAAGEHGALLSSLSCPRHTHLPPSYRSVCTVAVMLW